MRRKNVRVITDVLWFGTTTLSRATVPSTSGCARNHKRYNRSHNEDAQHGRHLSISRQKLPHLFFTALTLSNRTFLLYLGV